MVAVRRGKTGWVLTALVAMVFATGIQAAPGPEVQVRLSGSFQEHPSDGATWITLKDGSKVAPGYRILYKVDLTNKGTQEARTPVALGPIPAGTVYVSGTASARPGLTVEYSIDGGKTFAAKPVIGVKGKDGSEQTVPAPADRYTTIRWTWGTPLAAGASASVSYQVRVR